MPFLFADFFFFKINIFKNSFRNTIRVSDSLDPDLAQHFINCLQRFSADDARRHKEFSLIVLSWSDYHENSES